MHAVFCHTRLYNRAGRFPLVLWIACTPVGERAKVWLDLSCGRVHPDGDTRLGKPLCTECFDYPATVVWNAHAPELWRRTTITLRRCLDRMAAGHEVRVKVSHPKVAEFKARGLVHFHALIRVDGYNPEGRTSWYRRRRA
jgi:Replication initiator protein, pSAM2